MSAISGIIKRDFPTFVAKAFQELHGKKLKRDADNIGYVDYLASELGRVATGHVNRVCISLPPRHLKTKLGTALAAYVLGQDPHARVMVLCYNESLGRAIASDVRELMTAEWYKQSFATRLASDRVGDLRTTAGGGLFASWIGGGYTGRGADLLIIDDPVEINQGTNLDLLEQVNETFDTVIRNRLNSPKDGKIVIIAHRLHECDLPGHVLAQGGWLHLCLPFIATKRREYWLHDGRVWIRQKGELLRPDVFDEKEIRGLRKTANFESLFQQNIGPAKRRKIKPKHIGTFSAEEIPVGPAVFSVDPGFDSGEESSFTVVQVWITQGDKYYLIQQWRAQAEYDEVEAAVRRLRRRFQPAKILIEAAGYGLALCRCSKLRKYVKKIKLGNRSKEERFAAHSKAIRAGAVLVRGDSDFSDDFIDEIVDFSAGKALYNDQVDAMTQYLDYMGTDPTLEAPAPRACATYLNTSGRFLAAPMLPPPAHKRAISVARLGAIGHPNGNGFSPEIGSNDPQIEPDDNEQSLTVAFPSGPIGPGPIGSLRDRDGMPPGGTDPQPQPTKAERALSRPLSMGQVAPGSIGGTAARSQADRLAELQAVQDSVVRRLRSR